jgi:tRNA (cmo5U34)-methyltransferase
MNEFDIKAAEWDKNPMHWDRSEAIANEILKLIPLSGEMTALEYGAGTGITSFLLRDHVKEITLMDNSTEMVRVMNEKIKTSGVKNLKVLNFDLEQSDYEYGKFDLIFSQMVLHHVADIDSIINRFRILLNPGGYLAIADLYEEDGSFHGEGFTGHRGFNIEKLSGIIRKHKFENILHRTCFTIDRKISDTESKQFKVFILIANLD